MKKYSLVFALVILLSISSNVFAETEITTVDTKALGVRIDLFDYNAPDVANGTCNDTDINGVSPLKFSARQSGCELGDNAGMGGTGNLNTALQGIVKPTLNSNGYPVLYNNENLDVLFNSQTNSYKRVYSDVNHLFKRDTNGNLVFDSDVNYAYYDISKGNNGDFKVYTPTYNATQSTYGYGNSSTAIGFFPFNAYDASKTNVNPGGDYNHFFGVTISNTFIYPENGKNNGNDMFLNFSGDDDVWVFIDGVLVLDIGGIHSAVRGSINLTTGALTVSSASALDNSVSTIGTSNNINDVFAAAGKTFNRTANSSHEFKFFYLERGSTYSNMNLETNIWDLIEEEDIPEGIVEPPVTTGSWIVKFYKDDELQDTQRCTYVGDDKKCKAGDITNPGNDTYHVGSCSGEKVSKVESLVVSKNMNLYTCTPATITVNPDTGVKMLILFALILSVSSIVLSRNSLKKEINKNND